MINNPVFGPLLAEGKTKQIYAYPDDDNLVYMVNKDQITAGCFRSTGGIVRTDDFDTVRKPRHAVGARAEPEIANDTYLSFRSGSRVEVKNADTIADGLRSPMPGKLTFSIIRELAEDILLVSEDEIRATMKYLLTRLKILVEPSGAVSAAAVLHGKLPKDIRRVGVILSGGNVDFEQLAAL